MPSVSNVFVDASVLIYAEDLRDPAKNERALSWLDALWSRRRGRVSTQVLNEFYAVATRKLRAQVAQGDARAKVRRFQAWQPWQIDQQTVETAWGLEANHSINYWDALIAAAAAQSGCRYLLSEDLNHEQFYGRVQVIDPFRIGPEMLDLESVE